MQPLGCKSARHSGSKQQSRIPNIHSQTVYSSRLSLQPNQRTFAMGLPRNSESTAQLNSASMPPAASSSSQPLFSFGVISDIQYADIPDGFSFHGNPRFYRNSLVALDRAVNGWKAAERINFAVHLGDIIDGFHPKTESESALTSILSHFDRLDLPVYHMLGNHCLYNLPRPELNDRLGITPLAHSSSTPPGHSYYSFSPHPDFKVVVLDSYDVSVLGWPEGHPLREQAVSTLATMNPNENKNMPYGEGVGRRFVMFGGGVSDAQLDWLRTQLEDAKQAGQRVIAMTHLPFYPDTCPPACLIWNYEEVLQVLQQSGVVIATIAGHTHQNGYKKDDTGIHHIVLGAVLETPPDRDCYGHVDVYADRLSLCGVDMMASLDLETLQHDVLPALASLTLTEQPVACS